MSLFSDPTDLNAYGRNLAQLLLVGGVQLERLARGLERVTFKTWGEALREDAGQRGMALADGQTEWLWDTLTREPRVIRELGSRILSLEAEWMGQEPVLVLRQGQTLGVFLKSFSAFRGPVLTPAPEAIPDGVVFLHEALQMVPGKATSRRFECSDVECAVEFKVDKPGTVEAEAILMNLEPQEVTVDGPKVTACARSVNHAFTLMSRRLQPHRRNHGGRAYDHIAWKQGEQWVTLENVRCAVEAGKWEVR